MAQYILFDLDFLSAISSFYQFSNLMMLQMLNPTLPPLCNGFDLLIKQHVSHSAQITLSSAASRLFQNYKSVKTLHLEEISQAIQISPLHFTSFYPLTTCQSQFSDNSQITSLLYPWYLKVANLSKILLRWYLVLDICYLHCQVHFRVSAHIKLLQQNLFYPQIANLSKISCWYLVTCFRNKISPSFQRWKK